MSDIKARTVVNDDGADKVAQPTYEQTAYSAQAPSASKGSWLARVGHRASHIPNKPLAHLSASGSRETLPLRSGGSGGSGSSLGFRSHERLPSLQKTPSWQSSPTSPVSPTLASPVETEFGATPIDASFGDRLDPPERPAPPLPQLSDRSLLPSQRSRSGTATQQEPVRQEKQDESMNKYARQAGDHSYNDSDADADDEFERSVIASPTLPTTFDQDDGSDHPSESEEGELVDGEDTPTTQGWADREGRSPTGKITQWTAEQVADYVASLQPALKQYSQSFADEAINGDALIAIHHDELRELGISSVGHRLTILKAVYEQKIRSGVKVEEGDYVPLSAEGDKSDLTATQDDISRVIESIRLRDQRIIAAEAELRAMKQDLERIADENRKLREETLPIMRLMKDQRTPLPDPAGGTLPSPRDADASKQNENLAPAAKESKGSSLSRKFSTKKLWIGNPKQPSPTHPPQSNTPQPREVRDDGGAHLEASAAAMAASSHLTASMTSQTSPNSVKTQLSPTSPAYTNAPSSGGSYQQPGSGGRSFPRDGAERRHDRGGHGHAQDDTGTGYSTTSNWSTASTVVDEKERRREERSRRQAPTPSPREDEAPGNASVRERDRDRDRDRGDRDNPQVEIFKSFRVSIDDPCEVVLPVVSATILIS